MPPPDERAGSLYIYLVSCLLLLAIISGGALLVLYITLPETQGTAWLPIAGMLLVGTPWLFWTMTCLYRTVSMRIAARSGGTDRAVPRRTAAAGPACVGGTTTAVNEDATVDSPGGARRVRFGTTTVISGSQGGGGDGDSLSGRPDREPAAESAESNVDCSSPASHESELPLFAKT